MTAMIDTADLATTLATAPEVPSPVLIATLKLCAALENSYGRFSPEGIGEAHAPVFTVGEGRKYFKVIMSTSGSKSVHAFVDRDGNVYKAASYKAPAKGVRYNLLTDPETCYRKADWAGGYLYRGR